MFFDASTPRFGGVNSLLSPEESVTGINSLNFNGIEEWFIFQCSTISALKKQL